MLENVTAVFEIKNQGDLHKTDFLKNKFDFTGICNIVILSVHLYVSRLFTLWSRNWKLFLEKFSWIKKSKRSRKFYMIKQNENLSIVSYIHQAVP